MNISPWTYHYFGIIIHFRPDVLSIKHKASLSIVDIFQTSSFYEATIDH